MDLLLLAIGLTSVFGDLRKHKTALIRSKTLLFIIFFRSYICVESGKNELDLIFSLGAVAFVVSHAIILPCIVLIILSLRDQG